MTDVMTSTPPAAWYPDPARPDLLRWWDGSSWSVHTMARPDVAPAIDDPPPAPPPVATAPASVPPVLHAVPPRQIPEPMPFASGIALGADGPELYNTDPPILTPIERAARAEIYAKLASSHAKEVATPIRPTSDPFGDFSAAGSRMNWSPTAPQTQQVNAEGPLRSATLGVWLLVFWPFFGALIVTFGLAFILTTFSDPLIPLIALVAGYLLVPFLFASMDRSALGKLGHVKRPSGAWLLLTWLGYLIARTVILSRRSVAAFVPLLVYLLIGAASATFNVLTSPELHALLNPPTIEEQITTALETQNDTTFFVDCPDGAQPPYTCSALGADGSRTDIDVTLENGIIKFTSR